MNEPDWHSIWILGAGMFGQLAAQRISEACPQCAVTVVDPEPARIDALRGPRIRRVSADGIMFLAGALKAGDDPDWIIPAAPVHVAFEWICRQLSSVFVVESAQVPASAFTRLPNPLPGGTGTLYVSNAAWICPDDCAEPADCCTVTGQPHPCIVYRQLQKLQVVGFESIVIRSRQLLPGVGGYPPADLYRALERVRKATDPVLLSTACCCHGVLNAFRLTPLKS